MMPCHDAFGDMKFCGAVRRRRRPLHAPSSALEAPRPRLGRCAATCRRPGPRRRRRTHPGAGPAATKAGTTGLPWQTLAGVVQTEGGGRGWLPRARCPSRASAGARPARGTGRASASRTSSSACRSPPARTSRGTWRLDSLLFTSDNRLHAIVSAASLAEILSSGSHTCKPRHQMVRKQTDSFPVWVQGVCADQHLLHH